MFTKGIFHNNSKWPRSQCFIDVKSDKHQYSKWKWKVRKSYWYAWVSNHVLKWVYRIEKCKKKDEIDGRKKFFFLYKYSKESKKCFFFLTRYIFQSFTFCEKIWTPKLKQLFQKLLTCLSIILFFTFAINLLQYY